MIRTGLAVKWVIAATIGIAASGATGCSQGKAPKTAAESRPISTAEALEFGEGLADALQNLDADRVGEAMDVAAMMEKATDGVSASSRLRRQFLEGVQKAQERDGNILLREMSPAIEAGASMDAIRGTVWEGQPAVVLRMIQPTGGASYNVFLLDRRPDGRIRATDYYSLLTGELGSQASRRLYISAVARSGRGLVGVVEKLLGKDDSLAKHIEDLNRMSAANREGRPEETLAIYNGLPEEVKAEKIFAVLRIMAAQKVDDDAKYLEAMQDFARRFPGDPACDFMLLDAYVLQEQPEKALESLDRLVKTLGDDAFFKSVRGNILTIMKRPEDARAAYRAAIAEEPDLRLAYDGLLSAALEQKRFGEFVEMLDALESVFDEEIGDLSEAEDFAEFLASPEGKAWVEKREPMKPTGDGAPKP
jgi:tetratricopeptide (TPR) repeat protein